MKSLCIILYQWVVNLATCLHVPSDKLLHFLCSAMIMLLLQFFIAPPLAACVTLCIGIAKEVYDCYKPNPSGWSWGDLLADVLGLLSVLIFVI